MKAQNVFPIAIAALLWACGSDPQPNTVTYTEHIRPLLAENCVSCHTEGGIAPFSAETYDEAKQWAQSMASATLDRRMPPALANGSGDCNEFRGARWLSDD